MAQLVKNLFANAGNAGLVPGSGRYPGGGNGNPIQYFFLGNFMDRGTWQAIVHGVIKELDVTEQLGTHTHTHTHIYIKQLVVKTNKGKPYLKWNPGTFLALQWLRFQALDAGGTGLIPSQGSGILHATWNE